MPSTHHLVTTLTTRACISWAGDTVGSLDFSASLAPQLYPLRVTWLQHSLCVHSSVEQVMVRYVIETRP